MAVRVVSETHKGGRMEGYGLLTLYNWIILWTIVRLMLIILLYSGASELACDNKYTRYQRCSLLTMGVATILATHATHW